MRCLSRVVSLLFLTVIVFPGPAVSGASEVLYLRGIMNVLNENMMKVTDGVSRGDFARIEEASAAIADHERPPAEERSRIVEFLGPDARVFRETDELVHTEAGAMARAASEREMEGVLVHFSGVQKGCVSCHGEFKTRIIEHFYGDGSGEGL